MTEQGRGVVLLSATSSVAADWVRDGVVPCHVIEHPGWSIVVPASPSSAAAVPYDDALTVLAARHVGPRHTPVIGLFLIEDFAVITAQAGGRSPTRWALRASDREVVASPDLPVLTADGLHRALAAGAPAREVPVREVRSLWGRTDLTHLEWLVEAATVLGLPGARVLDGSDGDLGPIIRPDARSVSAFESVVKDVQL